MFIKDNHQTIKGKVHSRPDNHTAKETDEEMTLWEFVRKYGFWSWETSRSIEDGPWAISRDKKLLFPVTKEIIEAAEKRDPVV